MWVSRTHYELLFENLTRERTRSAVLESRIASMQATQEWLREHVNRLEAERGILTQARLGLTFPVPEIERAGPPDPNADAEERMRGGVVHGIPEDSMPISQLMSASLEDVGDEAAAALGVSHDDLGNAVYKR